MEDHPPADGGTLNEDEKLSICLQEHEYRMTNLDSVEVFFAYANYAEVNLYNSAGLPVKPFRKVVQ